MNKLPLQGIGILVTRPQSQSAGLVQCIEAAGGSAVCFPVIKITALDNRSVAAKAAALPDPNLCIFVSRNAVEYGLQYAGDSRIAAIGPATAAAVEASGRLVDIRSPDGFDSEHLLAEPTLQSIARQRVRIIRGNGGRELLADELTARGAVVDYLAVYERRLPDVDPLTLTELESRWKRGDIAAVTVMSVESLRNLVTLLPASCERALESTPLVTPAGRVLKEALERYPASRPILAAGPQASQMVDAIIALNLADCTIAP